jgi:8-oxo-dGTP diphosphatase
MIFVTRGILLQGDSILAAQRPTTMSLPLLWELPGGKIEPEELPEDCLVRETFEETMLHVRLVERLPHVDRTFRDKHYRMIPFICEVVGGKLHNVEHAQVIWQPLAQLFALEWAPAEEMVLRNYVALKQPQLVATASN